MADKEDMKDKDMWRYDRIAADFHHQEMTGWTTGTVLLAGSLGGFVAVPDHAGIFATFLVGVASVLVFMWWALIQERTTLMQRARKVHLKELASRVDLEQYHQDIDKVVNTKEGLVGFRFRNLTCFALAGIMVAWGLRVTWSAYRQHPGTDFWSMALLLNLAWAVVAGGLAWLFWQWHDEGRQARDRTDDP